MEKSLLRHTHGRTYNQEILRDRPATVLREDTKAMTDPGTAPWGLEITAADFKQLQLGFQAQGMEDKWDIAATGPDAEGVTLVHILRSWTGAQMYVLHVKPLSSYGAAGGAAYRVESFTWEKALGQDGLIRVSERQAKKEAVFLCRGLANCTIEKLPVYDDSIFWIKEPGSEDDGDKNQV